MKKFSGLLAASLLLIASLPFMETAAAVTILAPSDGAVLEAAGITVAGKAEGGIVTVTVNGKEVSRIPVRGGRFAAPVTLRAGENRLSFRTPGSDAEVRYQLRGAGAAGTYRFHDPYLDDGCQGCHGDATTVIISRHGPLCHSCHDRVDEAKFLHGPVGAGQCTVCHDPHGSANRFLLTLTGRGLCVVCHDQPSSKKHMDNSRNRVCRECHDPHGSGKKFFLK